MAGRTIAIGDIHGCSGALAALIDVIGPGPEDTLVTLGDHTDRGPDSCGVLDRLIALAGRCRLVPLLGDHEKMLVDALGDTAVLRRWLTCGGAEALRSYGWASGPAVPWRTGSPGSTGSSWRAADPTTRRALTCSSTPVSCPSCRWTSKPTGNE